MSSGIRTAIVHRTEVHWDDGHVERL
ncbi:hypothetical protein PBI_DYLAN_26 [Mycobacterium phage Dylan]|uniref:Uncharacterized protein n=2 Tax=Corndogvirus TaxID=1623285 RepID=S5YLI9_9CAUD|nr:hypothetical protein PBI_DYLAN_26 [Mycobacterium phage Dylan]AGT20656.1 hypothetical protein PBI_DYLAN_26 [Mycobacterium phage Dylan]AII28268.1 hypothetical protein PBI_YUNGJAMAL_29 [Mycobacterium phage YungJamal]ALA48870.1 hypothetical protein ZAKHE101_27 [Mycobacterium phage Zakhe101]